MRPQDIVILIKILLLGDAPWQHRDLAGSLRLSVSEISDSLHRSHIAGLIDESRRKVYRENLLEFIEHGLHYVFPALPGTMETGVPTAHSQSYFKKKFNAELEYVWPDDEGPIRGLSIPPLYKGASKAVRTDPRLHLLLSAIDIYRVGRVRELKAAEEVLQKYILV